MGEREQSVYVTILSPRTAQYVPDKKGLKDGFKSLFQLGVGCAHKPHFFNMMTLNPILTVSRLPGGRCVSETAPEAALLFTLKRRFHQLQS